MGEQQKKKKWETRAKITSAQAIDARGSGGGGVIVLLYCCRSYHVLSQRIGGKGKTSKRRRARQYCEGKGKKIRNSSGPFHMKSLMVRFTTHRKPILVFISRVEEHKECITVFRIAKNG